MTFKPDLDDFDQLDEDKIRSMAAMNSPGNSYETLLKRADEWRECGCTPIFIVASRQNDNLIIGCVARETFGINLN